MPAGDPQRTWFPEMVDELRKRWRAELPLSDLIQLRNDLDAMLHRIRSERTSALQPFDVRTAATPGQQPNLT